MTFRRKLKRIIIFAFLTTLILKIHYDYQALSSVSEKRLETMTALLNVTYHNKILNLANIKDIIGISNTYDTNQKKIPQHIDKKSKNPVSLSGSRDNESQFAPLSYEENTISESQINSPSSIDSRLHYDPSFSKKMEDAMEDVIRAANEQIKETNETPDTSGTFPVKLQIANQPTPKNSNSIHAEPKNNAASVFIPQKPAVKPPVKTYNPFPHSKYNASETLRRINIIKEKIKLHKPKLESKFKLKKKPAVSSHKVSHTVDSKEISLNATEISRLKKTIESLNNQQKIYNKNIYGPVKSTDTVIVIQVHNRLENLKHLVQSLSEAMYINSTLVIFSHDFWDKDLNTFIRSISDFRTMQIYFPYSIQLNPSSYPGRDPRDCLWNHQVKSSTEKENNGSYCLNANWPDSYGHYREATFTQIKHHWWWKLITIFDRLKELRNFTGQVLFLEEDHYVFPDFLHTLRLLQKEREKNWPDHLVLCLGNYAKITKSPPNLVDRSDWLVNKYNLGFAFDRRVYEIIRGCQEEFCNYDDYNWDWTLANIGKNCASKKFLMLAVKISRVLHIGSCGTHVHKKGCNLETEVKAAQKRIEKFDGKLFPSSLNINKNLKLANKAKKVNGGWGDYRDRYLCFSIANGTSSEESLRKLQFPGISDGIAAPSRPSRKANSP